MLDVGPSYLSIGVLVSHRIAAHLAYGTPLTPDQVVFLDQIKATDSYWTYDCYTIDGTVRNDYEWGIALKNNRRLVEIYLDMTRRNPVVELKHIFCSNSIVWRISKPVNAYSYTVPVFND